jgi:hypothetical protein
MKQITTIICILTVAIAKTFASTVTIKADGSSVSGVGNAHFFTDVNGNLLDLGDQVRVGFFNASALSTIVSNFNTYTDFSLLRSELANIFTPIGETGYAGTASGGKIAINNKQNLTTLTGALSQNITSLDPVASGHAGKQVYLWATDTSDWSVSTALAIVTDASWLIPGSNASNLTVNTAYVNTGSSSELILGLSGPTVSSTDSIKLVTTVPEPSTGALMVIGAFGLVALRRLRKV